MFGRILQPGSRQRPFVIAAMALVGIILVGLLAIGAISLFKKGAGEEPTPTATVAIATPTRTATPRPLPTATPRVPNTPVLPQVTSTSELSGEATAAAETPVEPVGTAGQPTEAAAQPSATPVPPDATTPNTGSSTLILLAAVLVAVVLVAVRRMRTAE